MCNLPKLFYVFLIQWPVAEHHYFILETKGKTTFWIQMIDNISCACDSLAKYCVGQRLHLPRKEKVSVCLTLYYRMTLWYPCTPCKKDNVHTQKNNGLQFHSYIGSLVEHCDIPQGYVNFTFYIGPNLQYDVVLPSKKKILSLFYSHPKLLGLNKLTASAQRKKKVVTLILCVVFF